MSGSKIAGPDRSREAILDVVDGAQHLAFVRPAQNAQDRAKDFFARNPHPWRDVGENGRLDEEALAEIRILRRFTSGGQPCAFLDAIADIAHDLFELLFADQAAHHGVLVSGYAGFYSARRRDHALEHFVVNRLVDESAAGRAPGLTAPGEGH